MSAKNKKTLSEKTEELDKLVAWFDSDDFELEQALEKFKQAEALAKEIEHDLFELQNTIEIVKADFSEGK